MREHGQKRSGRNRERGHLEFVHEVPISMCAGGVGLPLFFSPSLLTRRALDRGAIADWGAAGAINLSR
jgi:hypothetical protein